MPPIAIHRQRLPNSAQPGGGNGGACCCCGDAVRALDRRRFMQLAGSAGAVTLLSPLIALAAEGDYEAMVLGCIDPRMQEPMHNYTVAHGLTGKFSQFIIAGAAVAVVAPAFKDWHKAFWDNLATSVQLHHIKKVIAIDHRDCGAAKIAYGDAKVATAAIETDTHRMVLAEFRKQVAERHPRLEIETGLMALDGSMEMFAS
jgi:carbonic anhydrase